MIDATMLLDGLASVPVNVVVGLMGAAALSIVTMLLRLARDLYLRAKFPLAGDFITRFEDEEGGVVTEVKATATLKQRGRNVRGVTQVVDGGRAWTMEGRIHSAGRVSGTYDSVDPNDPGHGAFFLEVNGGHLDGMWAGYDSVNNSVTAGRWLFSRLRPIEVDLMTEADEPRALSILGGALGARYITRQELDSYRVSPTRQAWVAHEPGSKGVVGALTCETFASTEEFLASVPEDMRPEVARILPELSYNQIGLLKSIAVEESSRRRGVGVALVAEALSWLSEAECTAVVAFGWMDDDGCHVQGVMESSGLVSRGVLPGFWTRESEAEGYDCPTCGRPCECSAVLFWGTL